MATKVYAVEVVGHGKQTTAKGGPSKGKQGWWTECVFSDGKQRDVWIVGSQFSQGSQLNLEITATEYNDKTYLNAHKRPGGNGGSSSLPDESPKEQPRQRPLSDQSLRILGRIADYAHTVAARHVKSLAQEQGAGHIENDEALMHYASSIFGCVYIAATSDRSPYMRDIKAYFDGQIAKQEAKDDEHPADRHYENDEPIPEDRDIPF